MAVFWVVTPCSLGLADVGRRFRGAATSSTKEKLKLQQNNYKNTVYQISYSAFR